MTMLREIKEKGGSADKNLGLSDNIPIVLDGFDLMEGEIEILEKWGIEELKEIKEPFTLKSSGLPEGDIKFKLFRNYIIQHVKIVEDFFNNVNSESGEEEDKWDLSLLDEVSAEVYDFLDESPDKFLTYASLYMHNRGSYGAYVYLGACYYLTFYKENFSKIDKDFFSLYILYNLGTWANLKNKKFEKGDIFDPERVKTNLGHGLYLLEKKIKTSDAMMNLFREMKNHLVEGQAASSSLLILINVLKMINSYVKKLYSKDINRYSEPKAVKEILEMNDFDQKLRQLFLKTFSRYPLGTIMQLDNGYYILVSARSDDPNSPNYHILRESVLEFVDSNKSVPATFSVSQVVRDQIMKLVDRGAIDY